MAIGDVLCPQPSLSAFHEENVNNGQVSVSGSPPPDDRDEYSRVGAYGGLYYLPRPLNLQSSSAGGQLNGRLLIHDGLDGAAGSSSVDARSQNAPADFLQTKAAREVVEMGFSAEVVSKVNRTRVVDSGENYLIVEELLDAVIAYNMAMADIDEEPSGTGNGSNSGNSSPSLSDQQRPAAPRRTEKKKKKKSSTTTTNGNERQQDATAAPLRKEKKKKQQSSKVRDSSRGDDKPTKNRYQTTDSGISDLCFDGDPADDLGLSSFLPNNRQPRILSPLLLKEENTKLKSARVCKICLENEASIVFLPCGHLVSCSDCSALIEKCTICGSAVRGSVKVFLP